MAILAGKNEALARISNYSSDEEPVVKKPVEKEDDLMISYKKREEKKRKRKFNTEGSFWSFGKVSEPNRSLFTATLSFGIVNYFKFRRQHGMEKRMIPIRETRSCQNQQKVQLYPKTSLKLIKAR